MVMKHREYETTIAKVNVAGYCHVKLFKISYISLNCLLVVYHYVFLTRALILDLDSGVVGDKVSIVCLLGCFVSR